MKQRLARPGRGGQWSSFLSLPNINIPRTSADRLVNAHLKSLTPVESGPTGAVPELTDAEIEELAEAVWMKLRKKLGSKREVY